MSILSEWVQTDDDRQTDGGGIEFPEVRQLCWTQPERFIPSTGTLPLKKRLSASFSSPSLFVSFMYAF